MKNDDKVADDIVRHSLEPAPVCVVEPGSIELMSPEQLQDLVARLIVKVTQAQADCRTLAGLYYGSDDCDFFGEVLIPAGLTDVEVRELDKVWATAVDLPVPEGLAILRRALAGGW